MVLWGEDRDFCWEWQLKKGSAETLPEAQRAEEDYYPIDGLKIPTVTYIQKSITTLLGKSNLELLTVFAERMQG